MLDFTLGFEMTGRMLLRIAGGCAAVILFLTTLLLVLCVAGVLFDLFTNALAKHWEKSSHTPRNKLERIIMENPKRLGQ